MSEHAGQLATITRKIKFAEKRASLDSVARHLGMFMDRKIVTVENKIDALMRFARLIISR